MKKSRYLPIILASGENGILSGRNVTEGLLTLQILQKLKTAGLQLPGSNFNICAVVCDQSLFDKIRKMEETMGQVLILTYAKNGKKEISRRFRRKREIQLMELVIATGSDGLFSIIDQNPEQLRILTLEETTKIMESGPVKKRMSGK